MRERLGGLLSPLGIAAVYLVVASTALVVSDVVLVSMVEDPVRLRELQAIKGGVEIVLTALLIFGLVSVYRRANERKTRELERARDRFALLNNLLRHHVLNRMNVIQGYVDRLVEEGEDDRERLETIRYQSAAIVDLVENVRVLSGPTGTGFDTRAVDLSAVLDDEIGRARERHPEATFDGTVPAGVAVEADDSLGMVFEQLLDNAVEHNDSAEPSVGVEVEADREHVRTRVVDDGPGLRPGALAGPPERERRGHEGLGLFLVRTLVDRYGGDVWVETGDDHGGVVAVELPRA